MGGGSAFGVCGSRFKYLPLTILQLGPNHSLPKLPKVGKLFWQLLLDNFIVLLILHQLVQVLDDLIKLLLLPKGGSGQGEDEAVAQHHHQPRQVEW